MTDTTWKYAFGKFPEGCVHVRLETEHDLPCPFRGCPEGHDYDMYFVPGEPPPPLINAPELIPRKAPNIAFRRTALILSKDDQAKGYPKYFYIWKRDS